MGIGSWKLGTRRVLKWPVYYPGINWCHWLLIFLSNVFIYHKPVLWVALGPSEKASLPALVSAQCIMGRSKGANRMKSEWANHSEQSQTVVLLEYSMAWAPLGGCGCDVTHRAWYCLKCQTSHAELTQHDLSTAQRMERSAQWTRIQTRLYKRQRDTFYILVLSQHL